MKVVRLSALNRVDTDRNQFTMPTKNLHKIRNLIWTP